jgi:DNA-binding response OmpR family regulator
MKSPAIFVIDNNPIHRSLIKYHLNINKFENVHAFQSLDECLYRLQKKVIPDFIISDHDPAHHLDHTLVARVEKISALPRIVFFASSDDPILAINLLESGATDYIVKTSRLDYGINELIKNIKYLVREKSLA